MLSLHHSSELRVEHLDNPRIVCCLCDQAVFFRFADTRATSTLHPRPHCSFPALEPAHVNDIGQHSKSHPTHEAFVEPVIADFQVRDAVRFAELDQATHKLALVHVRLHDQTETPAGPCQRAPVKRKPVLLHARHAEIAHNACRIPNLEILDRITGVRGAKVVEPRGLVAEVLVRESPDLLVPIVRALRHPAEFHWLFSPRPQPATHQLRTEDGPFLRTGCRSALAGCRPFFFSPAPCVSNGAPRIQGSSSSAEAYNSSEWISIERFPDGKPTRPISSSSRRVR